MSTVWARLRWRNDDIGQAAVSLPESDTEIALTTQHGYEPNWLVASADDAAQAVERAGGRVVIPSFDIPVGRVAVAADPFDKMPVLVDLSKGATALTSTVSCKQLSKSCKNRRDVQERSFEADRWMNSMLARAMSSG